MRPTPPPTGRRISSLFVGAAMVAALLAGSLAPNALAAPNESNTPIANPDLVAKCGIDILVILDESGSIGSSHATDDVIDAFKAFIRGLKNTGSRIGVIEFDTQARLPLPGQFATQYVTVTDATIDTVFDPYIENQYNPNGSTHWEDAFRVARYFLPRPSPTIPHLVVFITDGDPNKIVRNDRVTYDAGNPNLAANEYELKVPLDSNETSDANENPAKDRAVSNANALKAQKSHILAVAVGSGLTSNDSLNRIKAVSGNDVFPGSGPFDIATDDVYREDDFDELESAMRNAAFALCAPSVVVRKLVDVDPSAGEDLQPAQGWSMTTTVTPTPTEWVTPEIPPGPTATNVTAADGFASFQWRKTVIGPDAITVTEDIQPGYFNDPAATTCTYRTPDTSGDLPLPGFAATNGGFSGTVPNQAIVTCRMVNRIIPVPAVTLKKYTNGVDADVVTGPLISVGSDVDWTYHVTNTGNVPLAGITVTDSDAGVTPVCPVTTLPAGGSTDCEATGVAVVGQYANTGTVRATGNGASGPTVVTATDPSHYLGVAPGIDIEKFTNDVNADSAPGPFIPVGDTVTWRYEVTNTGTDQLTDVVVTDDKLGDITSSCDPEIEPLDPAESVTCTVTGTAVAGQYANVATAVGQAPTEEVEDSDGSHYFGASPKVDIEKFVNLQDADTAPGPFIEVGRPVAWTYRIENTGNVPLTWSVSDDQFPTKELACSKPILLPGSVVFCFGPVGATAQPGQHENTATVDAVPPLGTAHVSDSDQAHYFGVQGEIDLEKHTNGEDADQPPGPFVVPGSTVDWTYDVTNTGNVALTNVVVEDLNGVAVTCPPEIEPLDVDETVTCTASGVAVADQYTNLSSVSAETPAGTVVTDEDPSNYFGSVPGIVIQKSTNGDDADAAPGPLIPVGGQVDWQYVLTNSGNAPVTNIVVTDDQPGVTPVFVGGDTDGDSQLDTTETWTYQATGTATLGQYENLGAVTGNGLAGQPVSDDDPSHYFGFVSDVEIVKTTNGLDANTAPGVLVPVGGPLTWTYTVTNPGNIPILHVVVTDDQAGVTPAFVSGDTEGDDELDPGESWIYTASGTATAGQYTNVGTVDGFDVLEDPVTDSDPSNAFGYTVGIDIEKDPAEATVDLGDPHTFTITVTNTGTAALSGVTVTDPVTPACDRVIGDLAVGAPVTYICVVDEVNEPIENTASVVGFGPSQESVDDSDVATVVPVAAKIGDLVWEDKNSNKVQDAGEPGIANARVDIADVDRGGTTTYTTDASGHYLAEVRSGHYTVTLDMTSVASTLTTPGSYDITLEGQEERLDADFGIVHDGGTGPDTSIAAEIGRIISGPGSPPALATLLALVAVGFLGAVAFLRRRTQRVTTPGASSGETAD